jgi:DNA-binding IclR family transcriptional regulator
VIEIHKERDSLQVTLIALPMGEDWSVAIFGGERPHIGAVALGVPAPSAHTPGKVNASVSVLTVTGHKEDELARAAAEILARRLARVVVVSCGIHKDAITAEEIDSFRWLVSQAVEDLAGRLT